MNIGDLKPDLEIDLSPRERQTLFHIEDAVSVNVVGKIGSTIVFGRPATSAETRGRYAHVVMEFQPGDTDTAGRVQVSVVIVWPGNKPQTVCVANELEIGVC